MQKAQSSIYSHLKNFNMDQCKISIYSEHMNKIRSLTLVIGVKEDKITGILKLLNPETVYFKVFLASEPGRTIEDRFKLAAAVNLEAVNKIYPINEPQETISFRFPCLEANNTYKATTTPWSASDLSKEVRPFKFNCNCGSEIIYSERIKQWKSLPSENWAEMMDFWHCHKPNTGRNEYNKSYAVSRFVPYDGCIFVGLNYFLVSPKNCENIKINLKQVQCTNCSRILGDVEDDRTIRLWKWNLKLSEKEKYSVLKPSYCGYIYALSTVLEQIDAHATYIYNVECQGKSQHGNRYLVSYFSGIFLLVTMLFNALSKVNKIWVFNSSLTYTNNTIQHIQKGCKVFYALEDAITPQLLSSKGTPEDLSFPDVVFDSLATTLKKSTQCMPRQLQEFQGWKVAVIPSL